MSQEINFQSLNINHDLIDILNDSGIVCPTEIQQQAIPPIQKGRDCVGVAQTGSGKSLAFLLPLLEKSLQGNFRVLIISPTRELADQLHQVIRYFLTKMAKSNIRSTLVVGGSSMHIQSSSLAKKPHFIVATPGRLIDHVENHGLSLAGISSLVLDEADKLMDMGFEEDIKKIHQSSLAREQTIMFTATFHPKLRKLAKNLLDDPVNIRLSDYKDLHQDITESLIICDDFSHKLEVLKHLLNSKDLTQAIVFTATRTSVEKLAKILDEAGYAVSHIHGKMGQGARFKAVEKITKQQALALIATDVAARGLDIPNISHVINFDIPLMPDDYIHRIGRTGRAGAKGFAVSMAGRGDQVKLKAIEKQTGRTIQRVEIQGLQSKAVQKIEQSKAAAKKQTKTKKKHLKAKAAVAEALRPKGWAKPKSQKK